MLESLYLNVFVYFIEEVVTKYNCLDAPVYVMLFTIYLCLDATFVFTEVRISSDCA